MSHLVLKKDQRSQSIQNLPKSQLPINNQIISRNRQSTSEGRHSLMSNDDKSNRRYNEGSVYRQASRFNPFLSSSTNISSSISGSVEIIISDLEERIDSQSKLDLEPLDETSNETSDDPEIVMIQNIINQKKKLKSNSSEKNGLQKTIYQLQAMQQNEKINKEMNLYKLRMQILQAFRNGEY